MEPLVKTGLRAATAGGHVLNARLRPIRVDQQSSFGGSDPLDALFERIALPLEVRLGDGRFRSDLLDDGFVGLPERQPIGVAEAVLG